MKPLIKFLLYANLFLFIAACSTPRTQFRKPELWLACNGAGSQYTAPLSQSQIHLIVIVDETGENHVWNNQTPKEWYPAHLADLQLVACVGPQFKEVIEECAYIGGPGITRFQFKTFVWLVEASTGDPVASDTFFGTEPRRCQQSEEVGITELVGNEVSFDQIMPWLQQYVEP